jgi:predicted RNA binding protein YcfA (HicA-like mRNA interferase family)
MKVLSYRLLLRPEPEGGFTADRTTGSHIAYYHAERHLRVVVLFHRRDVPKGTLVAILRHAGLESRNLY